MPEKIACAVLVSPSGLKLGSKIKMIQKIADTMSLNSMKEIDKNIIGEIFKQVKLEQDMPKLTEKNELLSYSAPTLVLAGTKDIFFPDSKVIEAAKEIISNLETITYDMGYVPSEDVLTRINDDIRRFLENNYDNSVTSSTPR